MADIQGNTRTANGVVQVNCFDYVVEAKIVDSTTGADVPNADFTGANAVHLTLGGSFATITEEHRQAILDKIQNDLLLMKAGIWQG